ncbi:MAG: diphthine synthase [Candidatus Bathyarchaeota archaeon]|nr:diphthine synthase [Candidatus Bathyarchaeota archaeon]MDH5495442.1 diphthine synthase [Candidatus Bathyarchaeota archaeon]
MGELVFVGLGLHDENDISLRGLEEVKNADFVFAELYTSLMEGLKIEKLENLTGKKIVLVSRRILEEEDGRQILAAALRGKTVFLVPGDPLIATTHIDLRIRAEKAGIKTRIVHGASIVSAAIGLSGLQNYKFGRSVTIPFINGGDVPEAPYNIVKTNLKAGFHTLCFLDIRAEEKRYMTIKEALETLLATEKRKRESIIIRDILVVGIAKAGSRKPAVKAGLLDEVRNYDFGSPPHTLIFPGKLHFMEVEALIKLANAPESIRKLIK